MFYCVASVPEDRISDYKVLFPEDENTFIIPTKSYTDRERPDCDPKTGDVWHWEMRLYGEGPHDTIRFSMGTLFADDGKTIIKKFRQPRPGADMPNYTPEYI